MSAWPDSPGSRSPYPGLRPFRRDEDDLFFGREDQVDQLLDKLDETHFLAVLGTSGSGKSSLVRAGLLPALDSGFMGTAGARWTVAELRPGDQPFRRLAASLIEDTEWGKAAREPGGTSGTTSGSGAVQGDEPPDRAKDPPPPKRTNPHKAIPAPIPDLEQDLRRGSRALKERVPSGSPRTCRSL